MVVYLLPMTLVAQGVLFRGKVESENGPLPGATVYIKAIDTGGVTDSLGNFSMVVKPGSYQVSISFTGFRPIERVVQLIKSEYITFRLEEQSQQLEEVVIQERAPDHNVTSLDVGITRLSMATIKQLPTFMGEADVMKTILTLPGVTSIGEGTSNVNVRGGSADQNLILIDGAPVFNPSHLMGLLSIFNPDLLQDLSFYRAGIPPKYGERVSSVIDFSIRNPDQQRWNFQAGLGLVSNKISVEGPIIPGRLSILGGIRISFPDYLFKISGVSSIQNTKANFIDYTAKVAYSMSMRNKINLTLYRSIDRFRPSGDSLTYLDINASTSLSTWATQTATLSWISTITEGIQSTTSVLYSDYSSEVSATQEENAFEMNSNLTYTAIKSHFDFETSGRHKLNSGFAVIQYRVRPGSLMPGSDISSVNPLELPASQGYEAALYLGDEITLKNFSFLAGLRLSGFFETGPGTVYNYSPGSPKTPGHIQDTTSYPYGAIISKYGGLEPRFVANYQLKTSSALKLSYNRSRQYIQQITNTTSSMPTDRWQISNTYIKPTVADQVSVGYFQNLLDNRLEASVEVFGKLIQNVPDYKDGANLLLNPVIETAVLQGIGKVGGLELQVKKVKGKWTGWFNYTLSRSMVKVDSEHKEERINGGQWYLSNFDRLHQLNLVGTYSKSRKLSFSFNFTYSSGRPVTYPEDKYYIGNIYVPNFTSRNNDRIPDYHRLDLALNYNPEGKKYPKLKSTWSFSVYNVYARKNAYSVFFKPNNQTLYQYSKTVDAYKLSIFGTVIPSVSYVLKIQPSAAR